MISNTDFRFADYPTLAVDNALVWVTVNVFKTNDGPFVGSIIFAFDKAALLDPAANTVTFLFLDPSALGGNFIQPAITQVRLTSQICFLTIQSAAIHNFLAVVPAKVTRRVAKAADSCCVLAV